VGRHPREETAAAAVVPWFDTTMGHPAGVVFLPQPDPALRFVLYLVLKQRMDSLTSALTTAAEKLGI